VKLNSCKSTNEPEIDLGGEAVIVTSLAQTMGKGQQGAVWESAAGDNLLFSVHLPEISVPIEKHYLFNMACSIGIRNGLGDFIDDVMIKWPNDIYVGREKISGMLLEASIAGKKISKAVIGVGVNVNQVAFSNKLSATSLKNVTEQNYELDAVLNRIITALDMAFMMLIENEHNTYRLYHEQLLLLNTPSSFSVGNNDSFIGVIEKVNEHGQLVVREESSGKESSYNPKHIRFDL
jgi:BirA family biotin operon repressor/biotin-[acetyl-CoA-carboxylase] ligase